MKNSSKFIDIQIFWPVANLKIHIFAMTFESRSNDRANGNVTEPKIRLYLNLRCSIRQKHGIFKFMSIFSNFWAHCP